jgi:hypothetical protein
MICLHESGYTLRQYSGRDVVYVTMPEGRVVKVIGHKLTRATAPSIILSIRKLADY